MAAFAEGRYAVLLGFGAFYFMGAQMGNVLAVLPFCLAGEGIYWAVGLVVPAFSVGFIAGNALSPLVVKRSGRRQYVIIATASATIAALLALIALAALRNELIAFVFLSSSLVIGGAMGLANNAYAEMISRMLTAARRNDLMLNQQAIGAAFTVIAMLLILPLLPNRHALDSHIDVLWFGAAAMAVACLAAVTVGPTTSGMVTPLHRIIDDIREGVAEARTQRWYRLFLTTQIVFVPVVVSETFFALRTSMAHSQTSGSLHVLVLSSAAGLLAGAFFWSRVFNRFGVRGMLVSSGTVMSAAAVLCAVNETIPAEPHLWVYGTVFFLSVLSNAAIAAATVSWVSAFATEEHLAVLISFAAVIAAVVTAILGGVFGVMAQNTAIWPVLVVFMLGLLAVAVALRAPGAPSEHEKTTSSVT